MAHLRYVKKQHRWKGANRRERWCRGRNLRHKNCRRTGQLWWPIHIPTGEKRCSQQKRKRRILDRNVVTTPWLKKNCGEGMDHWKTNWISKKNKRNSLQIDSDFSEKVPVVSKSPSGAPDYRLATPSQIHPLSRSMNESSKWLNTRKAKPTSAAQHQSITRSSKHKLMRFATENQKRQQIPIKNAPKGVEKSKSHHAKRKLQRKKQPNCQPINETN